MAETPLHRDVILDLIATLSDFFSGDADVYVSGNMMMYYVEGNAEKWLGPDVFVTRGIAKLPERDVYKVWREGKGPDAVIEVTSPSTVRFDTGRKLRLYRDVLKVPEYFLFDPRDRSLAGAALAGYRLTHDEYELIAQTAGRLPSDILGLHLEVVGEALRLFDPRRAAYLPTPAEIRAALKRESAARLAAEAEVGRLKAEIDELRRNGQTRS